MKDSIVLLLLVRFPGWHCIGLHYSYFGAAGGPEVGAGRPEGGATAGGARPVGSPGAGVGAGVPPGIVAGTELAVVGVVVVVCAKAAVVAGTTGFVPGAPKEGAAPLAAAAAGFAGEELPEVSMGTGAASASAFGCSLSLMGICRPLEAPYPGCNDTTGLSFRRGGWEAACTIFCAT